MGFWTNTINMLDILEGACKRILWQAMEFNYFTWVFSLALAKQIHLA